MVVGLTCFSISLLFCWAVLSPLLVPDTDNTDVLDRGGYNALNDQRERCVQVIKDLELDLATGKLSADEYELMRSSVGRELLEIVDKLKSTK